MASSRDKALYPPVSPVSVGLKGICPRCGQGRLFAGVLTPAKGCMSCKLDYSFIDSGDGPAVFVIMIMGFVLLGLALAFDNMFHPPIWVHVIIWGPVIVISCLWTLRISKGFMIGLQFNTDARQGTLSDENDET
ncbi:MAG: DUF983 domain-containing protein [Rhizobiaceae bacterium]|nr:DUF983 domain-containing protein [Rhizobiaceae bacterium]